MKNKLTFEHTLIACYLGFISQAIIVNLAPLLFITFRSEFNIPLAQITLLVTVNFLVQLLTDLIAAFTVDKVGYRISAFLAHIFCALGLIAMAVLPDIMDPFGGLLIAVILYAIGGGLIEVLASPIAEACPTKNKEATMSLLHSFYCWGQVFVVLASSLFFLIFGTESWRTLSFAWALIPSFNAIFFLFVPLNKLVETGEGMKIGSLLRDKRFWFFALLIFAAGASEHSMNQWSSSFAESSLGVSKTLGDILGPCMYAASSGLARVLDAKPNKKHPLITLMMGGSLIAVASYLLAAFSPVPLLALISCGICGFGVGILWPGVCSLAAASIKTGGTAMFAFLALAGDLGCSLGPTAVGLVSSAFGDELRYGLSFSTIFPLLLFILLFVTQKKSKRDLS
ncbi:MAG: MFS transporter [Clostridiales bacterium]|nr:MFS transporter [Clostridiales bacterium]